MIKVKNKPELLAPVGSMESLFAAVQNGCDAVYLGGKAFGARAFAQNFTENEIKQALDYAHFYGVRVYITVNTLYKDDEIEPVLEYVAELYHGGVDAVILQDIGLARFMKKHFPDLEMHASTQMTIHNSEGARQLKKWGFHRVVLARELTIDEIREIKAESSIEIETL
ncbi:MAG: U32 family peptidase, partial [Desulfobacterales bacterium]|nr:U32 family peptidase [Desulfobacterales bacterium]